MKRTQLVLGIVGAVILLSAAAGLIIVISHESSRAEPSFITGMAETAQIDVSTKVPGRIADLRVQEGDRVKEGDTLGMLESRALDAKLSQARSARAAAQSRLHLALSGLRPQEKEAAEKLYAQAKTQAELMEKTWNRVRSLSDDSVVSRQERDQVEAQYLAATQNMAAAEARLSMAREGSRSEDKTAAAALAAQADAAVAEAQAWQEERMLICPISGEVAKRIANRGEVVGGGAPILTVIDPRDIWIVLCIKETDMSAFRMGAQFSGRIPALGDSAALFAVSWIAPMGEFATWRPTSQKGGFDVKSFEIHLRPKAPIPGLRAGMSVNIQVAP